MKQRIVLKESDFHRVIKESVRQVLSEVADRLDPNDWTYNEFGEPTAWQYKDVPGSNSWMDDYADEILSGEYDDEILNDWEDWYEHLDDDNGWDSTLKDAAKERRRMIDKKYDSEERKREINNDWKNIELYSPKKKYSVPSTLEIPWDGYGMKKRKPGELAMDAQLPYRSDDVDSKGYILKQWNGARNVARNFRYEPNYVHGIKILSDRRGPKNYEPESSNMDDQDYFETKIKEPKTNWMSGGKDYYKRMKKLAQLVGGKRSKTDDERSFKRALKAADSRPLHRKGSANRELIAMDKSKKH